MPPPKGIALLSIVCSMNYGRHIMPDKQVKRKDVCGLYSNIGWNADTLLVAFALQSCWYIWCHSTQNLAFLMLLGEAKLRKTCLKTLLFVSYFLEYQPVWHAQIIYTTSGPDDHNQCCSWIVWMCLSELQQSGKGRNSSFMILIDERVYNLRLYETA